MLVTGRNSKKKHRELVTKEGDLSFLYLFIVRSRYMTICEVVFRSSTKAIRSRLQFISKDSVKGGEQTG